MLNCDTAHCKNLSPFKNVILLCRRNCLHKLLLIYIYSDVNILVTTKHDKAALHNKLKIYIIYHLIEFSIL